MRPRVVIIEDEKDIVELFRYNFRKEGFEVESFGRGREGLDYLRRNPADVLLLDILLPDEDGFSVARKLRHLGFGGRLIALSGFSTEDARGKGIEAGFDEYLVKPAGLAELRRVIPELP